MTSYFNTVELNTALTSIGNKLSEKASVANLYPVLKKATSSVEDPTPGYVYQVLIEHSFESADTSRHLVDYLNKRLQRPSPHGVSKTMKTINHLVLKGSRDFRNMLRENDEHIKNAPNYANQNSSYTGTEILESIRSLSRDILLELFRDDRISEDAGTDQQHRPPVMSPTGMGSFAGGGGGKYEGFGNSPISRSRVTDRVRDLLETVLTLPDPRHQIMALCLEDPVGGYTPVTVPDIAAPAAATAASQHKQPPRLHGGWSSSSEDEEEVLGEFSQHVDNTALTDNSSLESRVVNKFCDDDINSADLLPRLQESVDVIISGDSQIGVFSVLNVLQSQEEEDKLFKGLLLLEYLQHENVMSPSKLHGLFSKVSDKLEKSASNRVADKAVKMSLILNALRNK